MYICILYIDTYIENIDRQIYGQFLTGPGVVTTPGVCRYARPALEMEGHYVLGAIAKQWHGRGRDRGPFPPRLGACQCYVLLPNVISKRL